MPAKPSKTPRKAERRVKWRLVRQAVKRRFVRQSPTQALAIEPAKQFATFRDGLASDTEGSVHIVAPSEMDQRRKFFRSEEFTAALTQTFSDAVAESTSQKQAEMNAPGVPGTVRNVSPGMIKIGALELDRQRGLELIRPPSDATAGDASGG